MAATTASTGAPGSAGDGIAAWDPGEVILGTYEVRDLLGHGGMGQVYRVFHRQWKRDLAMKCALAGTGGSRLLEADLEREAETWIGLGMHRHIASCHYVRRIEERPAIFIEYVPGGDLAGWIEEGRLYEGSAEEALARILDLAIQFAWGLGYAHSHNLVHQDVKPHNALVTEEGLLKVTDFGLARALESRQVGSPVSPELTYAGMTERYASPEQAEAAAQRADGVPREQRTRITARTDLWSWGICLLEAFCGEPPCLHGGQWAGEVLESFLREDRQSDGAIPSMPESVATLLRRCFQKDPAHRPSGFDEVVEALVGIYAAETGRRFEREPPRPARDDADNLNNRGVSWMDLGRHEEARACFLQAVAESSLHPQANWHLGNLGQLGRALDDPLWKEPTRLLLRRILEGGGLPPRSVEQRYQRALEDSSFIEGVGTSLAGHAGVVSSVALSPDGRRVASGSYDGTLRVWDLERLHPLHIVRGLGRAVLSVAWSGEGEIAAAAADGTVCVWQEASDVERWEALALRGEVADSTARYLPSDRVLEVPDGAAQTADAPGFRSLRGHRAEVLAIAFSPDSRQLVSVGLDRTIRLWDAKTGRARASLTCAGQPAAVAFSAEGDWLAIGIDATVAVFDVGALAGGLPRLRLSGPGATVCAVAIDSEARSIAAGAADGTIHVWDAENGGRRHLLSGHEGCVRTIAYAGGTSLLSGGKDRTLRLWSATSGRQLACLRGDAPVTSVAWVRDGRTFVSGDEAGSLRHWIARVEPQLVLFHDTEALQQREAQLRSRGRSIEDLAAGGAKDDAYRRLLEAWAEEGYGSGSDYFRIFRGLVGSGRPVGLRKVVGFGSLSAHAGRVLSLAFSADGRLLASGGEDRRVLLWNLATGQALDPPCRHGGAVRAVAFAPEGRCVAAGGSSLGAGQAITQWSPSGTRCEEIGGDLRSVTCLAFSPDGLLLAAGHDDDFAGDYGISLWDRGLGTRMRTLGGHQAAVTDLAFSRDGRLLASASRDRTVRLWAVGSGENVRTFSEHPWEVAGVCLAADGSALVTGSYRTVSIWDLAGGDLLQSLEGPTGTITSLALSPDDQRIAAACDDRRLSLWDTESGHLSVEAHAGAVRVVSFSPDGLLLATGGEDRLVRLWLLIPDLEFDR